MSELRVSSLGWGVQSWTLAAMSALGELEPLDFALHSDTTWERSHTYQFRAKWQPWLETHNVKVVTVSDPVAAHRIVDASNQVHIPAFTLQGEQRGQLNRSCTQRWKIAPMRRYIAAELERRGLEKTPGIVEQWIGISKDEWWRAKDSDVAYITHRFPLIEKDMTRGDCIEWLMAHGFDLPGKSSCTFCPFHDRFAWADMKREGGADWQQAVEIDATIRNRRTEVIAFVHSARLPLLEAVDIPEDHGMTQPGLFDTPCDSGACFL